MIEAACCALEDESLHTGSRAVASTGQNIQTGTNRHRPPQLPPPRQYLRINGRDHVGGKQRVEAASRMHSDIFKPTLLLCSSLSLNALTADKIRAVAPHTLTPTLPVSGACRAQPVCLEGSRNVTHVQDRLDGGKNCNR